MAVQTEGQIFYEACKDIRPHTELLVWYGDSYVQFMGIPVALRTANGDRANSTSAQDQQTDSKTHSVTGWMPLRRSHGGDTVAGTGSLFWLGMVVEFVQNLREIAGMAGSIIEENNYVNV